MRALDKFEEGGVSRLSLEPANELWMETVQVTASSLLTRLILPTIHVEATLTYR